MKTTILTISLILITFFAKSQNWKSVPLNDTIYYTTPPNSSSNLTGNYLRCVFLDSLNIIGNDEVYFFHPTIENGSWSSSQICIDTSGPSWMGRQYVKKINGDEYYFNFLGDSILLKTNAQLNDSWTCVTDTAGLFIISTITNISTQLIDNTLDSIKEITLQAWYNGNTTTHYCNGYKIVLSKNHGILKSLQWEDFPYNNNQNLLYHAHIQDVHSRVNSQIESIDFTKIDFGLKYTPGNEWVFENGNGFGDYQNLSSGNSNGTIFTYHDSVISGTWLNAIEFEAKYLRKRKRALYHSYYIPPNPIDAGIVYSDSVWIATDTLTQNSIGFNLHPKLCTEYIQTDSSFYTQIASVPQYYTLDTFCTFSILETKNYSGQAIIKDTCYKMQFSVSGYTEYALKNYSSLGFYEGYNKAHDWTTQLTWNNHSILHYFKIQNCTQGIKFNVLALSTKDYYLNDNISIYPNPTKDDLFINLADNSNEIKSIKLYSLTGQLIFEKKKTNSISLENTPKGLYLIEIETTKGNYRKKMLHN